MCIIVDANRLGIFLRDPPGEDAAPIHKWLSAGRGSIVYSDGGGFTKEVQGRARERLLQYSRAGRRGSCRRSNSSTTRMPCKDGPGPTIPTFSRWRGQPGSGFFTPVMPSSWRTSRTESSSGVRGARSTPARPMPACSPDRPVRDRASRHRGHDDGPRNDSSRSARARVAPVATVSCPSTTSTAPRTRRSACTAAPRPPASGARAAST